MSCFIDPTKQLSWDALSSYINPYVLGAPDNLIQHNARLSAIEFCRRSGILHDENLIDLQTGVQDYFLTTVCDYEVVRVFEVTMLDRWVIRPSITKPRKFNNFAGFNSVSYYGTNWWCGPYGFYMQNVDVIHITPATQQNFTQGLRVEFIVQPKQDGCVLDNYLYEYWAEGIAAGAIARLCLIKNTSWYDPGLFKEFDMKFRNELNRARGTVDMNFSSGSMMMQSERWI
ncbi:MAG: hypothetical protein ACREQ5_11750 [Candidatus Dormibacteria bacterium]